ncbi:MAG: alkaline phosphatase family protein [Nitrospinae bacterium]|nr:alkaline phosphatase family protein [Nitrospinota bacterium]
MKFFLKLSKNSGHMFTAIFFFLFLPVFLFGPLAPGAAAGPDTKVVIIGFDGADPVMTEEWMKEGALPNLAKLREEGVYSPLGTTNPPQTPVSWSSFATGKDPGQTGIFDFLVRDPGTYFPDFALIKEGKTTLLFGKNNAIIFSSIIALVVGLIFFLARKVLRMKDNASLAILIISVALIDVSAYYQIKDLIPVEMPTVVNKRKGKALWELTSEQKIKTQIVRIPATFPAPDLADGHALSGLGVPDIRGTVGTFSYYTDGPLEQKGDTEMGGKVVQVEFKDGSAETLIYGPRNKLFKEPEEINIPLKLTREGPDTLIIEASGKTQTVRVGEWSNWFVFDFQFNPLIQVTGMSKFHLLALEPHLKLYMPPINIHPEHSPVKISHPMKYAKELFQRFGFFKTIGWLEDTWALNEDRSDEETFLEDVYSAIDKFEEMMDAFMDDKSNRLFIQVFDFTDRINHMFWRLEETDHPAYNEEMARKFGDVTKTAYIKMDEIVGKAMKKLDKDTVFMVLSDHGFASFKKSVNYNTWLVRNGFMALRSEGGEEKKLEDLFGKGEFWPNVDWSRTKAYAVGLGSIFINVKGREKSGIVSLGGEYEEVRNDLIKKLEGFVDEETGEHPVFKVYKREDIYSSFDEGMVPDLRAANNRGYRVSWQTSLGGIPAQVLTPNAKKWSGDHCSMEPAQVRGIFFANKKAELKDPGIMDIFPTVCKIFNIQPPSDIKGKALPLEP